MENVTTDELMVAQSAPSVGLSFLEKVLLALIDAHPVDDGRTRDERLRQAMFAVQGSYYRHGKKNKDDRLLLHWMASQVAAKEGRLPHIKLGPALLGEADAPVKFETMTELARAALARFDAFDPMSSERAQTQRLMDKFEEDKEQLIATVQLADSQPHVIEHELLLKVQEQFRLTDIAFKVPLKPSAF